MNGSLRNLFHTVQFVGPDSTNTSFTNISNSNRAGRPGEAHRLPAFSDRPWTMAIAPSFGRLVKCSSKISADIKQEKERLTYLTYYMEIKQNKATVFENFKTLIN